MIINSNNYIKINKNSYNNSFKSRIEQNTAMKNVIEYVKSASKTDEYCKAINKIKSYPEPLYFKISSKYHRAQGICCTKFKYNDGKNLFTASSTNYKSAPEATYNHILQLADKNSAVYKSIYGQNRSDLVVNKKVK